MDVIPNRDDVVDSLLEVISLQTRHIEVQVELDTIQKKRVQVLEASVQASYRILESLVDARNDPEMLAKLLRDVDVLLLDIRLNHLS